MSFFTDKSRDECWDYFDRHLALIPLAENGAKARRFLEWKEEQAVLGTVGSYLGHIKAFGIYLNDTPWLEATWDDVFDHIKGANNKQGRPRRTDERRKRPLGQYTKYQRMVMLREFYKWLLETDETPEQFRRLPFVKPSMEAQSESRDRVAQDELVAMIASTSDARDRCIAMLLADSGLRSDEASGLNDDDFEFDDYGCRVSVVKTQRTPRGKTTKRGMKTGSRKVKIRLTICIPYVVAWLNEHPNRLDEGSHPFLTSRSHRNFGARLSSSAIWGVVTRMARRARIRHVHPHMLRHTAASIRAGDGWNEEMMRLHFGWSKGSSMPSLYSHAEDDYEAFALRKAGMPVPPKEETRWRFPCPRCDALCEPDARLCTACHQKLGGPA